MLALARVRRGPGVGYLTDAFTLDAYVHGLLALLHPGEPLSLGDGELRFVPTSRMRQLTIAADAEVRRVATDQSNSSLIFDDKAIVKIICKLARGRHPEAELGRYLTDAGYANKDRKKVVPGKSVTERVDLDGC